MTVWWSGMVACGVALTLVNCDFSKSDSASDSGQVDRDMDGFSVPEDCDDEDPLINPAQDEVCDDGLDNDCDGATDCDDPDCTAACTTTETDCDDGLDNDEDGATDCDDPDCADDCDSAETDCDDGLDNDEDGATDCDDPDCDDAEACVCPDSPTPAIVGIDILWTTQSWSYSVELQGVATAVHVHVTGTAGAVSDWEEVHPLGNTARDDCEQWDLWETDLQIVSDTDSAVPGSSTAFQGSASSQSTMTWMVTLQGSSGEVGDCQVWGAQPEIYAEHACRQEDP